MKRSLVATHAPCPTAGVIMRAVTTPARQSGGELLASTAAAEREAEQLRDHLAAIEEEQATLMAELAAFEADYLREVVSVLAELHELEARIAVLVAKRSGAAEDKRAARSARARARETTAAVKAIPKTPGPLPTGDLKKLFREAAKRMHPDLAPDDETRQHAEAFMKRLNQAFAASDAGAIVDLVRQWESSPYATAPAAADDQTARAARRVSALQAAVERAQARLDEVRGSDLAGMMERAMAAAASGTDLLAEWRASSEAALAAARKRLAELEAA
jgi:hypothetical protein